jgi:hypothetical protein
VRGFERPRGISCYWSNRRRPISRESWIRFEPGGAR